MKKITMCLSALLFSMTINFGASANSPKDDFVADSVEACVTTKPSCCRLPSCCKKHNCVWSEYVGEKGGCAC